MKYYVMADIHGFYSQMKEALVKAGYYEDQEPHKIIICGDLFDRGSEALLLQQFVVDLIEKDQVILVKGNHEDLIMSVLNTWHQASFFQGHHITNGSIDTIVQLIGVKSVMDLYNNQTQTYQLLKDTPYIKDIIPRMVDYFETDHYIFLHGWLPCDVLSLNNFDQQYVLFEDWKKASEEQWIKSRWINGMEAHHQGIRIKNKTIVCGHWNCSFGHAHYEHKGGEFDETADYSPYYADGIIALDGCTIKSGIVNCVVIED